MTTINQLPPVTTPGSNDAIPVQQAVDGVTRYMTPAQLAALIGAMPNTNAALTTLIAGYPVTDPHVLNAPFWNGGFLCLSQG